MMDEPENLKLSRTLAISCGRKDIGVAFEKGRHFVWLEKGGYDIGVLLVNGVHPYAIVPVTDDPDLAVWVQEKFTDVRVICGDALEVVRNEGRVFTSMSFGFNQPFTREFSNRILNLLQHGGRDGAYFYFAVNGGDPSGEEALEEGRQSLIRSIQHNVDLSDADILAHYINTSTVEEVLEIRDLTSTKEGFEAMVFRARGSAERTLERIKIVSEDKRERARDRLRNFMRYLSNEAVKKKLGPLPSSAHCIGKNGKDDYDIVFMGRLIRSKVGEKVEKFVSRFQDELTRLIEPDLSFRDDKEGLIQEFFDAHKEVIPNHSKMFWDLYFSQEPEET
jgi:hypothetical protein